jgi:hypothetical protein
MGHVTPCVAHYPVTRLEPLLASRGLTAREEGVGDVTRGAKVLVGVEGLLQNMGGVLDREDRLAYERAIASAWEQLNEDVFERAWQEGRAMSMEQAIEYALRES